MKKVKQLSLIMILSIFVLAMPQANAQKGEAAGIGKANGMENKIPDLTEKQKSEIKTLRTAYQKDAQQVKNQMGIKRAELKALQQVENPDMDAINKKIEERAALRTELEKKTASYKQSIRTLLTDDQKVIFDKNMKNRHHGSAHKCDSKPGHSCSGQQKKNCKH